MKLNNKRTIFIGFAFMSICAFWSLYDTIIPLILKNNFEKSDTFIGFILALDNIFAMFMLPLFGSFSDKVHTRFGKRTPFIVFGTVAAVISMLFLPIAANSLNLVFFLIALGIVLVAMSTYRSPAVALMPDLTPKPLRSKANAIINLMGAVGGLYTLAMIKFLTPKAVDGEYTDYNIVFISVAALMIFAIIVLVLTIKENQIAKEIIIDDPETVLVNGKEHMPKDVKKSLVFLLLSVAFWFIAYNAVSSTYSRYINEVLNIKDGGFADFLIVGTIAAVVSYMPVAFISSKFGRKKIIFLGISILIIGFSAAIPFAKYNTVMYIIIAAVGFGWAAINVNSYPMVVEMSKGSDIGKYTGLYYTFSMAAQVVTPILSGALIDNLNIGYKILFPYAAFFSIIAFITMLFVKHGDSKPIPKGSIIENIGGDD